LRSTIEGLYWCDVEETRECCEWDDEAEMVRGRSGADEDRLDDCEGILLGSLGRETCDLLTFKGKAGCTASPFPTMCDIAADPFVTGNCDLLDRSEGATDALLPLTAATLLTTRAPRIARSFSSVNDMLANDVVESLARVVIEGIGLSVSSELRGESCSG